MNKLTTLFLAAVCAASSCYGRSAEKGFAIVIDPKSYSYAQNEVKAYASELEKEGLHIHYLIDKWGIPDSIRTHLKSLYELKKYPIEGAVFIGDIPIAMVRDAQHLTSAFKMDQHVYDWKESSVPSDRFYDDLNLQFQFIKRDSTEQNYFYYTLTPGSAQKLQPSFYSGRIRPTDCNGTTRYEKLKKYLKKVIREKQQTDYLEQVMFFSGNGFISESMQARIDEKIGLYEHFPWLNESQQSISYIDHKQDKYIKFKLMNEMQRNDLDVALLHHHGDWDTEYLNDIPTPNSTSEEVESVKLYLRESLRHAQKKGMPIDSAKAKLVRRFGVPDSWFENSFDTQTRAKDSIHLANLDLYLSDFKTYKPNCRMVILDACFNGSFHRDDCIANEYIFSEGNSIVALANSVNVIQDKWTDQMIGLVGLGMRVGNLIKYGSYLEAHVIGDPTFTFKPARKTIDINEALNNYTTKQWKNMLSRQTPYSDLQVLAIEKLMQSGNITSSELLNIFNTNKSDLVRVKCLIALSQIKDDNYIACLSKAVFDRYEMINRFALNMLAKSGDERLIQPLVAMTITNNTSERIDFLVKQALPMYQKEKVLKEFEKQFPNTNYMDATAVKKQIRHSLEVNTCKWIDSMNKIIDPNTKKKSRLTEIRAMRNYHVHFMVPQLLNYMKACGNPEIQQNMLEAFGWFTLSYRSEEIAQVAFEMSQNNQYTESVRQEASKTYKRLTNKNI